jgi:hypothetical protein
MNVFKWHFFEESLGCQQRGALFEPGDDEFTVKVTDKPEEAKPSLEVGFEYVCNKDNLIFLKKRK